MSTASAPIYGKDVGHVGAHLDVDVDEATVGNGHTSLVGGDFFAVWRAAYGLSQAVRHLHHVQAHGLAACSDDSLTSAALHPTKPARPLPVRHRVDA